MERYFKILLPLFYGNTWKLFHFYFSVTEKLLLIAIMQRLTEFCQEKTLVISNSLIRQHKRQLYTWTSPDGRYQNQNDYILCSWRWRSSIQATKTRSGADYGSDHELLIVKFRLKLNKVGKTTRPLSYDLNQIPYDYTVEVSNRFKGLDMIGRVPEELWTEVHDFIEEAMIKTIPKVKNARRENVCLRRPWNIWEKKRS